jgi:hypothetical protein
MNFLLALSNDYVMLLEMKTVQIINGKKVCSKCLENKDVSEFYESKNLRCGYSSICKLCTKKYYQENKEKFYKSNKKWKESNPEKVKELADAYRLRDIERYRRNKTKYYITHTKSERKRSLEYQRNLKISSPEELKEIKRKATENWCNRNPEKVKAHTIFHKAIREGLLVRLPCIVCNNSESCGHHEDYSKPLEVTWLCHKHHMELHRKYN